MKKILCLAGCLLALTFTPVFGQPAPQPPRLTPPPQLPPPASQNLQYRWETTMNRANPPADGTPTLTKFNLDFPGGMPAELVKAVEKATGKLLNVIIPDEDANFKLPPLKLHDVTFEQLSETMRQCSVIKVWVPVGHTMFPPGGSTYTSAQTGYYFKTTDVPPTDNSVWFFYAEKPPPPQPVEQAVRFYNLDPYLNRGFSVDDITTAIQTGWKMAGVNPPPELDYHKETKLLIAFGEPSELQTIQDVLNTLPQTQYSLPSVDFQIKQLQLQVDALKKKIVVQSSSSNSTPEEKSGK